MQYQMLEINIQDIKYQIRIIGYVGEMADTVQIVLDVDFSWF